jgi:hypothetical protein
MRLLYATIVVTMVTVTFGWLAVLVWGVGSLAGVW